MLKMQIAIGTVSLGAGLRTNLTITYSVSGIIQAVALLKTANGAYMLGSMVDWTSNRCTVGLYNTHPSVTIEGDVYVAVFYK